MAGWIVVARHPGFAIWEARFAVFIDGRRVAKLGRDAAQDFTVEAGVHHLRVRQQLCYSSRMLEVDVADGETVVVRTHMRFWATYLAGFFGSLVGGMGFWLFAQPTLTRAVLFCVSAVGLVTLLALRVTLSLRPDPAAAP